MARIIYGHRYYGRVDRAAGLFHVATAFFHINYFPLWPVQSCVIRESACGWSDCTGEDVGLRLKSVLVGYLRGWLAGLSATFAALGGFLCGLAAYPLSMPTAVVLGLVFGLALGWGQRFVLSESPPPPGAHPSASRLVWHLGLTGLVLVLGGGQLMAASVVRGMVGPQFEAPLTVLPLVAAGLLAAAQLVGYAYRLSLFLTPAGYERAVELAEEFGLPRRLVDKRYRQKQRERDPVDF